MKRLACVAASILIPCSAAWAGGVDVGVSIGFSQPGVYGRVDIGRYGPPPMLVVPAPVWVAPPPVAVQVQPVYLWVPPVHRQHWSRYCYTYQACGAPVYFVQDRWYRQTVMVAPEQRPDRHWHGDRDYRGNGNGWGHGHGRGHGRGHDRDD